MKQLKWICSEGGPLILLSAQLIPYWKGCTRDGADYRRACNITENVGIIPVGTGNGLVLGDEPLSTCWLLPSATSEGLFVRWRYADSESIIIQQAMSVPDTTFVPFESRFPVNDRTHILFDSALSGDEVLRVNDMLSIELCPGNYMICTSDYRPNEQTGLLLHKLKPITE